MPAKFVSDKIIYLNKVDSTNLYAQELLKQKKLTEGHVIVANEQSNGKGQRDTEWLSNPNENLTFSVILQPHFLPLDKVFYISKIVALSLADFLDKMTVKKIQIKWPNDLYVDGTKIAGILIENNLSGSKISSTVVGIGLNVNQREFNQELRATSMYLINKREHSLNECLHTILDFLHQRHFQLYQGKFEQINSDYLSKLFALNVPMQFSDSHSKFTGKIVGVNENGFLKVEKEDGTIRNYDLKEIKFIN